MIDTDGPLTGRKIVVTGGAGFVGSHIVGLLVEAGAGEIIVVDNLVRGRRSNLAAYRDDGQVRLVEGDVRDRTLMARLLDGADTVFHQAALRITQCAVEPRAALQVMADATFDLLELSVAANVRKVVMASSASIYGLASTFPTPETQHPYDNRTLYGAAKMFGEGLLRAFHDMNGLDYVALRYFNVYGPRMDIHGKYTEVLIRWMERIEAGEAPLIFGDGLQTMDMIHVEDVARANVLAATSGASDVALNVGSGGETSLLDLAKLLATRMGRPGLVPEHMPERGVNPVPRRLADTSLARDLIGFESEIDLLTGMDEVIAWWRSERDRFFGRRTAAE
ncbi:MAG: NAD-dependent epimerase/dehydratase family protein [Hansschlegelia sp.]